MLKLRTLAADVYMSVTRIADGCAPDETDRFVLGETIEALQSEAEQINVVQSRGAVPYPRNGHSTNGSWMNVTWLAAQQLAMQEVLGGDPIEGLDWFAKNLELVAKGDRKAARSLVPLVQRISALAETRR